MNKKQHTSKGLSQATQLETAVVMNQSFVNENVRFKAFDPELDMAYAAKITDKANEIYAMPNDTIVVSKQMKATKKVVVIANSAIANIRTVKYFVGKAFPDDELTVNEFCYRDLRKAQNSQIRFILFLKSFVISLLNYKTELIAKGLSQTIIDEIVQQSVDLEKANIDQEQAKKARYKATGLRIKAMDELWEMVGNVAKAGKIIFEKEPDTLRDFVLDSSPKKKSVKVNNQEVNAAFLQGTITDSESGEIIEDAIVEIEGTELTTTTNESGEFYIDEVVPGTYTLKITAFGYKELLKTGIKLASDNEDQKFAFSMEKS